MRAEIVSQNHENLQLRLGMSLPEMDYNQLKIRVLGIFKGSEELSSDQIRGLLQETKAELSDKAMKMALMRYTRQGILARSKKSGVYHYRLTEKGLARRNWLAKTS